MKNFKKNILSIALLLPFVFSSCTKEDVPAATVVNSKVFALSSVGTAGVSGTATVVEKSDATLSIELNLKTRLRAVVIPHTHLNTAAEGGDIALTLKPVDGTTGRAQQHLKHLITVLRSLTNNC
jgi:hypothetical protein